MALGWSNEFESRSASASFEAKTHLSILVDEVTKGGEIIITRHGKPVAKRCAPKLMTKVQIARRGEAIADLRALAKRLNIRATHEEIKSWIEQGALIVPEASFMIARILQEPHRGAGDDLYGLLGAEIVVPSHWPIEISNALLTNVRRRRLALSDVAAIIGLLCQFESTVSPPSEIGEIESLANFALHHDLAAYEAAYVHLALTQGARLATVDPAMRAAAARLNVSLLPA